MSLSDSPIETQSLFGGRRPALRFMAGYLLAICGVLLTADSTVAQQRALRYPGDAYYSGFASYYRGDLRDAAKIFDRARQSGYRGATGRWVDSICYHTMMGECLFQLGEIDDALTQYDTALQYVLLDPVWMSRADFKNQQVAALDTARARITWGNPTRNAGNFPDSMSVMTGRADGQQALQQGGVFQQPELRQFNVVEIARCTTLAIQRRNEILGPLGKHDKMIGNLIQALRRGQAGANHWGQPWAAIPLAMALRGQGDLDQASALLQNSLVIGGQYYHPLTSHALLELGKIRLLQGKNNEAAGFFLEATYPAAIYEQLGVMEEAFRWGTTTHLMSKAGGVYAPLNPAAQWARTRGSQQLKASLPLLAASCSLEMGDAKTAAGLLNQSKRFFGRTDLARSPWAARLSYAQAHAAFQSGDLVNGVGNLGTSMQLLRNSGIWMFRLALVDRFFAANLISDRVADELYTLLLREPTAGDWLLDPMETLSLILTPHPGPYERWMEIAISQQENDRAIEIADRLRRHRFYSSLPLGGRVLALRWLVSAPDQALGRDIVAQRQKLLLQFPALVDLQRQAASVQASLAALPITPEESSDAAPGAEKTPGSARRYFDIPRGDRRRLVLETRALGIRFPPLKSIPDVQQQLQPNQLIWMFIETGRGVYSCMVTQGEYSLKPLPEAGKVKSQLTKLYRDLGLFERNTSIDAETLASEDWHESILALRSTLASDRKAEFWANYDEIIIIPDGLLWYLPFEMLPAGDDPTETLLDNARIRYAPTLGTALPSLFKHDAKRPLGVVLGRLFPKDEPELASEKFDEIQAEMPEAVKFETKLPGPSGFIGGLCSTLLVLDDLDDRTKGLYAWAPLQLDQGQAGSSVSAWMMLPWGGPAALVLPGFHTAAERGLRPTTTGNEIFASMCALMAAGTDTILISRWRMGGQTSFDLMREFVRELPNEPASLAWRRSVQLVREQPLDPDAEPRLKEGRDEFPKDSRHPLFWAGYLLVDRGGNEAANADE